MDEVAKKMLFAAGLVLVLYVIGIMFYHNMEGWTWVDSIYFMTATFTTVGYGDITPKSEISRLFTVFFMWTGISVGFYLIYTISRYREEKIDQQLMSLFKNKGKEEEGGKFRPTVFEANPTLKSKTNPSFFNPSAPRRKKSS